MIQKPSIALIFVAFGGILFSLNRKSDSKSTIETSIVSNEIAEGSASNIRLDSIPEADNSSIYKNNILRNNISKDKMTIKDTIPFRYLPLKEQLKKAERFHVYGDLKLGGGPLNYELRDYEKGILIRENYPNILNYWYDVAKNEENQKHYSGFKVEFYNSDKTLKKVINLEKETPYMNNRFKIIQKGAPDMEHYKSPSTKYSGGGDLEYITYNEISTDPNGFTVLQYQLLSISGSIIIDWEETLEIYSRNGKLLGKLKVAHDVYDCWVSNDGKKIAYLYGGEYSSEPNNMPNGVLRIHDIESSMLLYEQTTQGDEHFATLDEIENGFLNLGITTNKPHRNFTFFDLENNMKYSKEFSKSELLEMSKKPWTNYVDVLKNYPFEREYF